MPGYPTSFPRNYIANNQGGIVTVSENNVNIEYPPSSINFQYLTVGRFDSNSGYPTKIITSTLNTDVRPDETYKTSSLWYLSAGENYQNKRLTEISFAEIFSKVNTDDASVKYYGTTSTGKTTGNYYLRFIDFDRIDKENRLFVVEDEERPIVYQDVNLIGFDIVDESETETVFRHRGRYEPKTKKVLNFWAREDSNMTEHYNTDFLIGNTRWGVEDDDFGLIPSLFYSKISPADVMKISSTSKFKSLYPLINEVAIDKKDYFCFNSNWDNKYFNKYIGLTENILIEGSTELKEQQAFFGSKLMITPDVFDIQTFTDTEVTYEIINPLLSTDVKSVNKTNKNIGAVSRDATKGKIKISIDGLSRLLREMFQGGAENEFKALRTLGITRFANLTDDEIQKETKKYLIENIIPLYQVTEVFLYIKNTAVEGVDEIIRLDLTENQKVGNGYEISKNTKVDKLSDFSFKITQELDTKKYLAFSLSLQISKI
jgi:hypothetical protein